MRAIFISYRREDTEGQAGRLFDDLVLHFGEDAVFMDVAGIEPGRDFRRVIDEHVASCGVLFAVIGKSWLEATDGAGQLRLENPMDFVRLEIASALKRDIPVIPVLVRGASMPRADQLPPDLAELAYRNGVELTHARWDSDVQVLIKALRPHVELPQKDAGSARTEPAARVPDTVGMTGAVRPSGELGVGGNASGVTAVWAHKSLRLIIATSVVVIAIVIGGYVWYEMRTDRQPASERTTESHVKEAREQSQTSLQPFIIFEPPPSFASYRSYLQKLGYVSTTGHVSVAVDPQENNAYYDGARNLIVLGKPFASDTDVIFREYTHHALQSVASVPLEQPVWAALESALADHFPCSFSNDASFGEKSAPELRKLYGHRFDKPYIRNLKNNRNFSAMSMRSSPQDVGEIWSGAFWEIRELLGQETADTLLFSTWVALRSSDTLNDPSSHFAHTLLETAQSLQGGTQTDHIRVVLERRGLQF
jgi:hypothetical protein